MPLENGHKFVDEQHELNDDDVDEVGHIAEEKETMLKLLKMSLDEAYSSAI